MLQNTFPDKDTMAELTASMLLEIDAVYFRAGQPCKLTSGLASPCRKLAGRGLNLYHLATCWDVLKLCRDKGHFDVNMLDEVEKFLKQPLQWSADHGGSYKPAS